MKRWKGKLLMVGCLLGLSACSFGIREDVDQIGSMRKSYTLGWKEGPRDSEYRPYRQQVVAPADDCEDLETRQRRNFRRASRHQEGS